MTTIYKLCFALGLLATGGEVVNHGDEHAATIKRLAAPLLLDRRPDKGIREIPVSDFEQLPNGIQRVQD
ncbi:MAG: hypothetical protein ACSHYB_15790 [Roseibacillus sp.]